MVELNFQAWQSNYRIQHLDCSAVFDMYVLHKKVMLDLSRSRSETLEKTVLFGQEKGPHQWQDVDVDVCSPNPRFPKIAFLGRALIPTLTFVSSVLWHYTYPLFCRGNSSSCNKNDYQRLGKRKGGTQNKTAIAAGSFQRLHNIPWCLGPG